MQSNYVNVLLNSKWDHNLIFCYNKLNSIQVSSAILLSSDTDHIILCVPCFNRPTLIDAEWSHHMMIKIRINQVVWSVDAQACMALYLSLQKRSPSAKVPNAPLWDLPVAPFESIQYLFVRAPNSPSREHPVPSCKSTQQPPARASSSSQYLLSRETSSDEFETAEHYFLDCKIYIQNGQKMLMNLFKLDPNLNPENKPAIMIWVVPTKINSH